MADLRVKSASFTRYSPIPLHGHTGIPDLIPLHWQDCAWNTANPAICWFPFAPARPSWAGMPYGGTDGCIGWNVGCTKKKDRNA